MVSIPREGRMGSKGLIVLPVAFVFLILLSSIQGAVANHLAAERSSCQVVDLSPCRDFVTRSRMNPSGTCCLRLKSAVQSWCGCRFPTGRTFLAVEQAQFLGDACKLTPEALGRCFDVSRVMKSGAKFSKQTSTASTGSLQTENVSRVAKSGTKFSEWNSIASTDSLQIDGSRMTASPTESLDGKSATSKRSLSEFCTDCKEGDYNVSSAKLPPAKPPPS